MHLSDLITMRVPCYRCTRKTQGGLGGAEEPGRAQSKDVGEGAAGGTSPPATHSFARVASLTLLHYIAHAEKVGSHFGSPGLPGYAIQNKAEGSLSSHI